jgi:hypothetical protein
VLSEVKQEIVMTTFRLEHRKPRLRTRYSSLSLGVVVALAICGTSHSQSDDELEKDSWQDANVTNSIDAHLEAIREGLERPSFFEPGTLKLTDQYDRAPDPSTIACLDDASPALKLSGGLPRLKLGVGYGQSLKIHDGGEVDQVEYVAYYPGWEIAITEKLGGEGWYAGNLDLSIEGMLLHQLEPHEGFAAGSTLGLRYNFLQAAPVIPFIGFGGGVAGIDLDLFEIADGFAFPLYANAGVFVLLSERIALTAEWRFQHISNGGLFHRNQSLNEGVAIVALTVFFSQ